MDQTILNLTGYEVTPDKAVFGVVEIDRTDIDPLCDLLEFDAVPTPDLLFQRATAITNLAQEWWKRNDPQNLKQHSVLIDTEPWFVPALLWAFDDSDITVLLPYYAPCTTSMTYEMVGLVKAL